jgi:hypothetical protein
MLDHGRSFLHSFSVSAVGTVKNSPISPLGEDLLTSCFSILLIGVMTIADEADSQLSQAMESYIAESRPDVLFT